MHFTPRTFGLIVHDFARNPALLSKAHGGTLVESDLTPATVAAVKADNVATITFNWTAFLAALVQMIPSILALIAAFGGTPPVPVPTPAPVPAP